MPILLRKAETAIVDRLAAIAVDCTRAFISMPALLQHVSKTSRPYRSNATRSQNIRRKTRSVSQRLGNVVQPAPAWKKEASQLREPGLVCAICPLDGPRGIECS